MPSHTVLVAPVRDKRRLLCGSELHLVGVQKKAGGGASKRRSDAVDRVLVHFADGRLPRPGDQIEVTGDGPITKKVGGGDGNDVVTYFRVRARLPTKQVHVKKRLADMVAACGSMFAGGPKTTTRLLAAHKDDYSKLWDEIRSNPKYDRWAAWLADNSCPGLADWVADVSRESGADLSSTEADALASVLDGEGCADASDVLAFVAANPFKIARRGMQMEKASKILLHAGVGPEVIREVAVFSGFCRAAQAEGHMCIPASQWPATGASTGDLENLRAKGIVRKFRGMLCSNEAMDLEYETARKMRDCCLLGEEELPFADAMNAAAEELRREGGLSEDQSLALDVLVSSRVSLLTASAGCGKTYLLSGLIKRIAASDAPPRVCVVFCAPTHKATNRIREMMDSVDEERVRCSTLQKFVLSSKNKKKSGAESSSSSSAQLIVVDEFSMVDSELFGALMDVVWKMRKKSCWRLVLCGDPEQLRSVGPGDVMRQVMSSGVVPCARLETQMRCGGGGMLGEAAARIAAGDYGWFERFFSGGGGAEQSPELSVVFVDRDDRTSAREALAALSERLLRKNGACIACRHVDVDEASAVLRPVRAVEEVFGFAPGDRVMCCLNDEEAGVFNGLRGDVRSAKLVRWPGGGVRDVEIWVGMDNGRSYLFHKDNVYKGLRLGYCCTVHVAQGSESDHVAVYMPAPYSRMYTRNILYTALTRAKRTCTLIVSREGLKQCLCTPDPPRHSNLRELIARFADASSSSSSAPQH